MSAGKDGDQKVFDRIIHWIGIVGRIDDTAPFQKCLGGRARRDQYGPGRMLQAISRTP